MVRTVVKFDAGVKRVSVPMLCVAWTPCGAHLDRRCRHAPVLTLNGPGGRMVQAYDFEVELWEQSIP
jgi:hypothetical protein